MTTPQRRRSDTNPEIVFCENTYTIRVLEGVRVVLRRGRGHLWHMCRGPEAWVILAGLDTVAVL